MDSPDAAVDIAMPSMASTTTSTTTAAASKKLKRAGKEEDDYEDSSSDQDDDGGDDANENKVSPTAYFVLSARRKDLFSIFSQKLAQPAGRHEAENLSEGCGTIQSIEVIDFMSHKNFKVRSFCYFTFACVFLGILL